MSEISDNLSVIQEKISAACLRADRDPGEVRLVAVTKTVALERIKQGMDAGLKILGENYIQEAQKKIETLGRSVSWHFIGRLQSNKAKFAVRLFDLIHSVDTLKLAQELNRRAQIEERRLDILVQVNISGEETKGGVGPGAARDLLDQILKLDHLAVKGLMTMPPFFDQPEKARPYFAALRALRDEYGPPLTELSMGMSGDFEVAIEEGATLVRVGTAIFGSRG